MKADLDTAFLFGGMLRELEKLNVYLWRVAGEIEFGIDNNFRTAYVAVNSYGHLEIKFNRAFLDSLNDVEKMFVLLHELFHVTLSHFQRLTPSKDANRAADCANNSTLFRQFNFKLDAMPVLEKLLVMPDNLVRGKKLLSTLSAEEYLLILRNEKKQQGDKKNKSESNNADADAGDESGSDKSDNEQDANSDKKEKSKKKGKGKKSDKKQSDENSEGGESSSDDSFDDHNTEQAADIQKALEKIMEYVSREMRQENKMGQQTAKEKRDIKKVQESLNADWKKVIPDSVLEVADKQRKVTWAEFSRHFTKSAKGGNLENSWLPNRRTEGLASDGIILPSEKIGENENGKIKIILFLDTSASCDELRPYFFGFAQSLPKDIYEVEAVGFTTTPYRIDLDNPAFKNGGTNYQFFQQVFDSYEGDKKYAFVFTDGDAIKPTLKNPEIWTWFLPECHFLYGIPDGCPIQMLKDFE